MSESHYFHEAGGSLPPNHPTYIERKADGELFDALKRGELCYVLNARQMGKSSLRARVMEKLQSENVRCTFINIGDLTTDDQVQWYTSFISELNNNLKILESREEENWILQNKHRPPNLVLMRFFTHILLENLGGNKIIIFLDEIDTLRSRKFKDDFLGFIRSCYNQRANNPEFNRIVFCLLGVAAPGDLITDKQQSFNIGKDIELTGLEYSKAKESFAQGLTESVNNPEGVIHQIFNWTNGQPFLTQKLCHLVVENAENRTINIDLLVKQNFLDNWESKSDGIKTHFKYISDCLVSGDSDNNPISLLVLLGKILDGKMIKYNPQNSEHIKLKLSGLITIQPQGIHISSKLYAQTFNKNWIKEKLDSMPKTWFPQGKIKPIIFVSPPSKLVKFVDKLIDSHIISTVICLLLIDLLSIMSAYYWFSSEIWTNSFNKTGQGAIIEFIRASILIIFTAYSSKYLFKEETKQVLTQDNWWWMRSLIVIIGFLLTIVIVYHHLYISPRDLADKEALKLSSWSFTWLSNYFVPYLCYLPYSLVNFIIVGTPLISITMYASIVNVATNIKNIKIVDKSINEVNDYIDAFLPISNIDKESIQEQIIGGFKQVSEKLLKDLTRYSIFFWGILFIFIFEARLGLSTLSEKAAMVTFLDYSIGLIGILFILYHGIQNYYSTFKKTNELLKRVDGNYQTFNRQHNTQAFLSKVTIAMFKYIKKPYTYFLIIGVIALLLFIFSVPISK